MKNKLAAIAVAAAMLVGCSPDELEVSILTSDIQKAQSGSYGMASATATFDSGMNDVKEKFPQIRAKVMPYLGKSGQMILRSDKIVVKFDIPVVSGKFSGALETTPLAKLVLDGDKLKLESTSKLKALNSELSDIDFSLGADLKAKHLVFNISGDTPEPCKVKATAVFVDGEPKVTYAASVADGDSVDIEFRCEGESSIYSMLDPFIEIVK